MKRIIALPGDWVGTRQTYDVVKVPEGHCWVEGDNAECSMDSRSFGPVRYRLYYSKHLFLLGHAISFEMQP